MGDIKAFVDNLGEPVCLVGWSSGGRLALGVAAHSDSVANVVLYETGVWSVMRENDLAGWDSALEEMNDGSANDRLVDAARAFHAWVATDNELAALETNYFERCAGIVPAMLQEFRQGETFEGPGPTDPEALAQVAAPVLLLRGQETLRATLYADSEQHIAQHVANALVHEPLPSLGHMAPLVSPEPIATELIPFFKSSRQPT